MWLLLLYWLIRLVIYWIYFRGSCRISYELLFINSISYRFSLLFKTRKYIKGIQIIHIVVELSKSCFSVSFANKSINVVHKLTDYRIVKSLEIITFLWFKFKTFISKRTKQPMHIKIMNIISKFILVRKVKDTVIMNL